ncbi:hypothetical protein ElyMa_003209900 [Elysia marginata]|uniref:Uncharacterized protein n=1 Tax=Elysia marginata TaxID=1093978 RepID=A0AAV4J0F8_9GAST|nr:hypothetical protein ElyMa_003209900 [Elysia marginata]
MRFKSSDGNPNYARQTTGEAENQIILVRHERLNIKMLLTHSQDTRRKQRWFLPQLWNCDRLCGLVVGHSLGDRVVRGSIPGRVKLRTLKLVLAGDPPIVWHYGFSAKSGRPRVRIM